jgi:sec-independent protein translocase protein TatB
MALWIKKARRLVAQVKQEVEQELQAEELRQSLKKNIDLSHLDEITNKSPASQSNTPQDKHPHPNDGA